MQNIFIVPVMQHGIRVKLVLVTLCILIKSYHFTHVNVLLVDCYRWKEKSLWSTINDQTVNFVSQALWLSKH